MSHALDLFVGGAKLALARAGLVHSRGLRAPARELDEHERQTFERLFLELEHHGVPGFTDPAVVADDR